MTFIFSINNMKKMIPQLKGVFALCCLSFNPLEALEPLTPIPVPPGTILTCNPLRVDEYINSLEILERSDLANVIRHLPIESEEFVEALNQMHPALLQDITFATDQNMQTVRQTLSGRNAFLRHGTCKKFEGLFSDHCNIGPYQMWITPFGVFNDQSKIDCLQGYRSSTPGIMIGMDSQPNKHTVIGFGLGYSYTDLHWKKNDGHANWQTGYFGVYATSIYDCFYLDGSVLGSYEFYRTKRNIRFTKFEDRNDDLYCGREDCCEDDEDCCRECVRPHRYRKIHRARRSCGVYRHPKDQYRGYAILSHVGFGFNFDVCGLHLIPFTSIDYDFVDQDGHREHKARSLNLKVRANHSHLLRGEVGMTAMSCIPYGCGWARPSITVSYVRNSVLQGNKFKARFVNYDDSSFTAVGTKKSIDLVCPGFGLEMQFSSNWIMAFNYDAELSRQRTTQRATCRIDRAY